MKNWRSIFYQSIAATTLVISLCITSILKGQDIHFSQFFLTDLTTNPANTGQFDADYRIQGVHRVQWRSVTTPYSTFQVSADAQDFKNKEGLGLGLRILNDRAGDSRFNTFSVGAFISGTTSMNENKKLDLHTGLYLGYTHQRIDLTDLRFDEQFNGFIYDASRSNGESLDIQGISRFDVHAGLQLVRKKSLGRTWSLGASVWNLSTPDVSFDKSTRVNLRQRLSLHGQYSYDIDEHWDIIPGARIMLQGPYQEILAGGRLRYTWNYDALQKRRAFLGAFSRLEDGAYLCAGLEHDEWTLGISYDVNLSSLEVASRNRGALEITGVYLFDVFNETRVKHRKCLDVL